MSKITVIRYHDFCAGHTVTGHEGKCRHLHGHNYRVHFHVQALHGSKDCPNCDGSGKFYQMEDVDCNCTNLDEVGRVIDFSVVKDTLCEWLETHWDHKFLINYADPRLAALEESDPKSLVICQFNPTAENMAQHLVEVVGPNMLNGLGVELIGVELSETRKCSVTYFK